MTNIDIPVLIPILLLILLTLFIRIQCGSWLMPGAFFSLFWIIMLMISIFSIYKVHHSALWWIFCSAVSVYTGSLFGGSLFRNLNRTKRRSFNIPNLPRINLVMLVCFLSGIVYVALQYKWGAHFVEPPIWAQIVLSLMYAGAIFSGLIIALYPSRNSGKLVAVVCLLPVLLLGIVKTGRSGIVLATVFCIASYFSAKVLKQKGIVPVFTKIHFFIGSLLVVFLVIMNISFYSARRTLGRLLHQPTFTDYISAYLSTENFPVIWPSVRSTIFGHVSAFSFWFKNKWDSTPPTFGVYTFAGPFNLLNLAKRPYPEDFEIEPNVFTNVYTIFRELIEDFTPAGALIVLFILGVIATRAYYWVSVGKMLWLPILIAFYAYVMFGIFSSIFRYNSPILAILIFAVYLFCIKLKTNK